MTNEEKVQKYIMDNNMDCSPLFFTKRWNEEPLEVTLPQKENYSSNREFLKDLVRVILQYTKHNYSINSVTKEMETVPGRNRTSLDLWRHIIYFFPEISIFEVMRALHSTTLTTFFCYTIEKRVFPTIKFYDLGVNTGCSASSVLHPDEYDLLYKDWENIGL